jgi:two-component system heavy metal sensor histidine kinase CusS
MKPYSIYSRLLFLYGLTGACLVLCITTACYYVEQTLMDGAAYQFITNEIDNIRSIYNEKNRDEVLLEKLVKDHPLRTRDSLYRYYVRIMDGQGRVQIETPGMSTEVPESANQPRYDASFNKNKHYLMMVSKLQANEELSKTSKTFKIPETLKTSNISKTSTEKYLQVVLDRSHEHFVMHDRKIFLGLLCLGIFLSLFLGKMVTKLGLKSLDILTDTVRNITEGSLDQRVNTASIPRELNYLAESFNHMLNRIETSFLRLKQMSADMSHELRTPMNNLSNQAEWLLSVPHTAEECHQAQISMLEELQRMTSLIENILFLARAESRWQNLEKQEVKIKDEVVEIASYYQALAEDKKITILHEGDASLHVNVIMFRRLLSNLLSNTLKYTYEKDIVKISIVENNHAVQLIFQDQGPGIDANHLPYLFDRFYRVDDARSVQAGGHGLGLAIVKTIVELHAGTIDVKSKLGQGCCVIISLPKNI